MDRSRMLSSVLLFFDVLRPRQPLAQFLALCRRCDRSPVVLFLHQNRPLDPSCLVCLRDNDQHARLPRGHAVQPRAASCTPPVSMQHDGTAANDEQPPQCPLAHFGGGTQLPRATSRHLPRRRPQPGQGPEALRSRSPCCLPRQSRPVRQLRSQHTAKASRPVCASAPPASRADPVRGCVAHTTAPRLSEVDTATRAMKSRSGSVAPTRSYLSGRSAGSSTILGRAPRRSTCAVTGSGRTAGVRRICLQCSWGPTGR